ncbi:MAG TPA: hypothetical protein VGE97_05305, partial [Nitrososphaera sp.]
RLPTREEGNRRTVLYKLKRSLGKTTYPGPKQVHRIRGEDGQIKSDIVALEYEKGPEHSVPLLIKYPENRRMQRELPTLDEIQKYHLNQVKALPEAYKRLDPTVKRFPVVVSDKLEAVTREFRIGDK